MKKILVLGSGMGGVEAAISLTKRLKGDRQSNLLSNRDFLYIYPASIWLTVGKRTRFETCYAIGDSSYFEGPVWRARQGHLAEVMARTATENIIRQERGEPATATFREEINLLCIMDTGNEGVFVYRNEQREIAPRGTWAHWAELAWEKYYKLNKLGQFPRLM